MPTPRPGDFALAADDGGLYVGCPDGQWRDVLALIVSLLKRVNTLENNLTTAAGELHRADVVDELPANAVFGALIRLRGDATGALYLGNGMARPLTKLTPSPL